MAKGKAGCGCLIFILIVIMVLTGLFMHPLTLKFLGNRFSYEDKASPSDAIFVPRFPEDKEGELYVEAFRDYWAGKGKIIWVEDDKIFGISIIEMIHRMARSRNIKEDAIRQMDLEGEGQAKAAKARERFHHLKYKTVIVLVPEYASRRFHLLYNSSQNDGKTVFLVKPVSVSSFKRDSWWKDAASRSLMCHEVVSLGSLYLRRLEYGKEEKNDPEK